MSASMIRNFHKFGRKMLQAETHWAILKQTRGVHDREIIHQTVPYFPEQEKKMSLDAEYPDVEILHDEFKYVERLIPPKTVPPAPEHGAYPTPSGWVPPNESLQPKEYAIRRTRNHMLPCYYRKHFDGRETVKVKNVYGDIWKLKDDAAKYLEENGKGCDIQVHEIGRFIRFRGNHIDRVAKFLLSKGF